MADTSPAATEVALQRLLRTYLLTGLLFLLLPGTFLGVWNLVSISGRHSLAGLSPSWLQAHGHAQIFGWIGTFIIGIGYYSLAKMGRLRPFAVSLRLGKLGSVDRRRYPAMGRQHQHVELARPAAGIGSAPTDRMSDFFRDREWPSVQTHFGG
jgi:hypothetical protein